MILIYFQFLTLQSINFKPYSCKQVRAFGAIHENWGQLLSWKDLFEFIRIRFCLCSSLNTHFFFFKLFSDTEKLLVGKFTGQYKWSNC